MRNGLSYKSRDFECGLIFQTLRNKARLRQQDIAKMVGVGVNTVQYWESGATYPKVEALKKLFAVYVRFNVFSLGQELTEAEELWEKVREAAPRLNALFDREWFGQLLESVSRDRQLKAAQPIGSDPKTPNNLPQRLSSFIGRSKERATINAWLSPLSNPPSVRLVTLCGAGGCGKTSLALEIAREMLSDYPQGVWLVELAPLSSEAGVVQALSAALGLKEQAGSLLLTTITNYLREKRMLLVLDNCEHLIAECARVIDSLLRDCPQLVVLTTSREILKVSGESVFRVPSLSLPPAALFTNSNQAQANRADELMEYEAVQLFVERARSASPSFMLSEQNKHIIVQLCRRLDGIPLAIELAVARLRVLSVFELDEKLSDRFRLLKGGSDRTVLPRQQTLRATVEWSYDLLSEPERLLFRRLSVFTSGWTLQAAEEICALDALVAEEIFDLLHELVNKSLIVVEEQVVNPLATGATEFSRASMRFRLLETLREYGQEQLDKASKVAEEFRNENYELSARHLLYYTALAAQVVPSDGAQQTPHFGSGINALAIEHPNFRQALSWCCTYQPSSPQLLLKAMELASSIGEFWLRQSYLEEAYQYLSQLRLRAIEQHLDSTSQYGWVGLWLGKTVYRRGDFKAAKIIQEEMLNLFTLQGHKGGIVRTLYDLAMTADRHGQIRETLKLHRQSLDLAIEAGDTIYIGRNLYGMGQSCIDLGEYDEAASYLQPGLKAAREAGDPWGVVQCLISSGILANLRGDYHSARNYLHQSVALSRELGDKTFISNSLFNLAYITFKQGEVTETQAYLLEALAIQKEIGNPNAMATTLAGLAEVFLAQENFEEASRCNQEALDIHKQLGFRQGVANGLLRGATLERHQLNYEAATSKLRAGLIILWEMEQKSATFTALVNYAGSASDYFYHLKAIATEEAKAQRYLERSLRLAGITTSFSQALGLKLTPNQQQILDQVCERGRAEIGAAAFETSFEAGRIMSQNEAVAYALSDE